MISLHFQWHAKSTSWTHSSCAKYRLWIKIWIVQSCKKVSSIDLPPKKWPGRATISIVHQCCRWICRAVWAVLGRSFCQPKLINHFPPDSFIWASQPLATTLSARAQKRARASSLFCIRILLKIQILTLRFCSAGRIKDKALSLQS